MQDLSEPLLDPGYILNLQKGRQNAHWSPNHSTHNCLGQRIIVLYDPLRERLGVTVP